MKELWSEAHRALIPEEDRKALFEGSLAIEEAFRERDPEGFREYALHALGTAWINCCTEKRHHCPK